MSTPKRPQSHIVGDVGHTQAALVFKKWGWTADRIESDYGEDLACDIFRMNQRTAFHFRCQVKSTSEGSGKVRRLNSGDYSVTVSTRTASAWLLSYFPVLLLVYDSGRGTLHWSDASSQVRNQVSKLEQKTLTLRVRSSSRLADDQASVSHVVQAHYAKLFRLDEPTFECGLYPVTMPGYRSEKPFGQSYGVKAGHSDLTLGTEVLDLESAPAWATSIRSMFRTFVSGWRVSSTIEDFDRFTDALRALIADSVDGPSDRTWTSYVISPIRLTGRTKTGSDRALWNREMTDWWSYSKIAGRIVDDCSYAFRPPDGYLRQIARRAASWETFHFVNPVRDLALQLFAEIASTWAYQLSEETMRRQFMSQFMPWKVQRDRIEELNEVLRAAELVFRELGESPGRGSNVQGIICTFMFEPTLGVFSQTFDWRELEEGVVKTRLTRAGTWDSLPGGPGDEATSTRILGMMGERFAAPPKQVTVSERNYIPGLPVDHARRLVQIQRFRCVQSVTEAACDRAIEDCRSDLIAESDGRVADASWQVVMQYGGDPVIELEAHWEPSLEESSAESADRLARFVEPHFNDVLPHAETMGGRLTTTYKVLTLLGQLYFESGRS